MGADTLVVDYCCGCCFSVVDSFLTVTLDESGLEESVLTSTLRELLLDSVTGEGAAAAAGAGVAVGAAAAVGGACWQPMSVSPKAARAKTGNSLQKFGFIVGISFLVAVGLSRCVAVQV
jgi:hypothetical protein